MQVGVAINTLGRCHPPAADQDIVLSAVLLLIARNRSNVSQCEPGWVVVPEVPGVPGVPGAGDVVVGFCVFILRPVLGAGVAGAGGPAVDFFLHPSSAALPQISAATQMMAAMCRMSDPFLKASCT